MNARHFLARLGLVALTALSAAHAADRSYDLYLHTLDAGHPVDSAPAAHAAVTQDDAYRVYLHTLDTGTVLQGDHAAAPTAAAVPSLQEHRPSIAAPTRDARAE